MDTYTAIIVDDEAVNILLLRRILSQFCPNIEIIGEATCMNTAVEEINDKHPDIIFLDIILKEGEIFEVIDQIDEAAQIIFVTSEQHYALTAFRYNAADYVMKPLVPSEVVMSVSKAARKIEMLHNFNQQRFHQDGHELKDYIAIPSLESIDFLKIEDIMFFTGDGKYTSIHLANGKKHLTSKNLADYERTLNNPNFFRIHHSYLINMRYVTKVTKKDGSYCEMANGVSIPIAKRRQEEFNRFIRIKG